VVGKGPAFIAEYLADITTAFARNKLNVLVASKNDGGAWSDATDKFQPTTAGYYQVSFQYSLSSITITSIGAYIYLNGASRLQAVNGGHANAYGKVLVSGIIWMNGSTDFVEFYTESSGTGTPTASNLIASAALVRAA